ncbi:MAG: TIGR02147 family protein [Pseudobdellovibrionaceae bacterium]
MTIWEHSDYKKFIRDWISQQPKQGRGMAANIASTLAIHSTMVSHILNGNSHFTIEQAIRLGKLILNLNANELKFFVLLVQMGRASNNETREYFLSQVNQEKTKFLNLADRLPPTKTLELKDQALYYSEWYYSGLRLMMALPGDHSISSLARALNLNEELVRKVLDGLIEMGILEHQNGDYKITEAQTYLPRSSPFVNRHHTNWRLKLLSQLGESDENNLHFTNAITLSHKDFFNVRENLVKFIQEFRSTTEPSPPEELACLTIDWFRVNKLVPIKK